MTNERTQRPPPPRQREVIVTFTRDGQPCRASGYHLRDDLILTAGHIASAESETFSVEYAGRQFEGGSLVWAGFNVEDVTGPAVTDLALIRFRGLPSVHPTDIAFLDRDHYGSVMATSVCYPSYASGESVHLSGRLQPRSGSRPLGGHGSTVTLYLDHDGPRLDMAHPHAAERWSCASGAPVMVTQSEDGADADRTWCVGVLSVHVSSETERTLRVASFEALRSASPLGAFPTSELTRFWTLVRQDPALTVTLPYRRSARPLCVRLR